MTSSLIFVISERRKYFSAGYRMHQTSALGRLIAAETRNEAAARDGSAPAIGRRIQIPCRIQAFGWYKKPMVAFISSQIRVFWNKPSSDRAVSDCRTLVTTDSSTSRGQSARLRRLTQGIADPREIGPSVVGYIHPNSCHQHKQRHQQYSGRMRIAGANRDRSGM
jgi:hypothetical protein